jgi:hypothetical protein
MVAPLHPVGRTKLDRSIPKDKYYEPVEHHPVGSARDFAHLSTVTSSIIDDCECLASFKSLHRGAIAPTREFCTYNRFHICSRVIFLQLVSRATKYEHGTSWRSISNSQISCLLANTNVDHPESTLR